MNKDLEKENEQLRKQIAELSKFKHERKGGSKKETLDQISTPAHISEFMRDLVSENKIALIIPDIFTMANGYRLIRENIANNFNVSVVSLSPKTFQPFTNSKTSLIFLSNPKQNDFLNTRIIISQDIAIKFKKKQELKQELNALDQQIQEMFLENNE